MDRISGLMPQVGWSPLLSVVDTRKAPATTVEPASTSANTNSGLGADVDARTQMARIVQMQARNRDLAVETAVIAQTQPEAPPDPDAPTGPPPTFDVSPLEAQAAALRMAARSAPEATDETGEEEPAPKAPETAPDTEARAPMTETTAEPPAEPSGGATAASGDWHTSQTSAEKRLDLTR